ncbi:DUF2818 family protein [Aquabacterium sp.]|uniref:DUF2818 family protein n=1 Tax=Aquabacterium sp. TaxID=1872578 RepID=UPI0035B0BEFF
MDVNAAMWWVLALGLTAANLPFVNNRLFLLGPARQPKTIAWRLLEWLIYCTLATLAGRWVEGLVGQVYPQGWEFYAVLGCLYLTFAFPGFVWQQLRRRHSV